MTMQSLTAIAASAEDRRARLLQAIESAIFGAVIAFDEAEVAAKRPEVQQEEVKDIIDEVANVGVDW